MILRFLGIGVLAVLVGCSRVDSRHSIVVSIAPLGWIASNLVDSTVRVTVMVPVGSSPESYEPSMRQIQALSSAKAYISTGLLDFEGELSSRIGDIAPDLATLNLSEGLNLIEGNCLHEHHDGHNHAIGIDPHIWLSPSMMRIMVDKVAELLCSKGINACDAITRRADSLKTLIDSIDSNILRTIAGKKITFAIVHPSLSYFARDYGMVQIPIEVDGKEPNARSISDIVSRLKKDGVKFVLYDIANSNAAAKVVSAEIGGELVQYDPLRENWIDEMRTITHKLCN